MKKFSKSVALGASLVSLIALTAAQVDAQRRPGGGPRASVRSSAGASVNRAGTNDIRAGNRTNINSGNRTNINTGDVNISRDVDIDVDHGWDHDGWGGFYAGAVVGATVATATAWRLGAYYSTLPTNCVVVYRAGATYYQCGTYWYQPRYSGMTVTYVAVVAP